MSDTAESRHVYCKFGLVNLAGLIPMRNKKKNNIPISAEIVIPLFSHESYKIKTTLSTNLKFFGTSQTWSSDFAKIWFSDVKDQNDSNFGNSDDPNHGKYYQKKFRRNVLWDFGDGTQIEGYQAEHAYTKPGRYKISCTFFDINRKGWVNDFSLYVIVKEVIPTYLRFDKNFTKTEITCSKIERIARIESLISNTVDKELNVGIRRVFSDDENTSNYKEIGRSYNDISKKGFFHMEKYWCALQNKQTLFYNSDQVYLSELTPTDVYRPQYNKLYCKFYYDEANKETAPIGLSFYQVIPYKNIDENLKTITVINPYTTILDREGRKTYKITQVYTEDQLPEGVSYCGMRGWVDIFYRNDYIGNPNTLSIYYDIENENITGELQSSDNYLNINPLGLTFNVTHNIKDDIRMGLSANGFLKPVEEGAKLIDSDIFIDQHLRNALYKGIDLNCYIIPYITYDNSSFKIMDDAYYVPKDVKLDLKYSYQNDEKYGKPSEVIQGGVEYQDENSWMYCVPFILNNYIDITLNVEAWVDKMGNNVPTNKDKKKFSMRLTQKPLQNPKSVKIPREKTASVDVDRLLDVYMAHPMFKGKENLRSLMKSYVNSFVENMITEGINFLDNTANIRTCYLSNLLSILKMMGEDVTEFEYTSLEGVNDLKKFARILSINHGDLVGHVIESDYEININKDNKGINVGDLIGLDDVLYLTTSKPADDNPRVQDNYGKIIKVKKDSELNVNVPGGVDLIVHDRYTDATKIVNFRTYLELIGKNSVSISDYDSSWGWNLLLPDGFQKIGEKIKEYQIKEKNKGYDSQQKEFFRREITRLKLVRKELIEGYYDFYLLNPNKDDIRVGNFLRNEDIIPKIQSSKEWDKLWGITHDILMKIIIENAGLSNGRDGGDDYNGDDSWQVTYINLKQALKLGTNTEIEQSNQSNTSIVGQVQLRGEIMGEGKNSLYIGIDGGYINYVDEFDISSNFFECEVSGQTISGSGSYTVIGEFVSGNMEVTLSGSLQNPVLKIETNLNYNPTVTEGNVQLLTEFTGKESFDDNEVSFNGKIIVEGLITGVGDNELDVSIIDFKVGDKLEKIEIKNGNTIIVKVYNNGQLEKKEYTITVNEFLSNKMTVQGTITYSIEGTVRNPIITFVDKSLEFNYIYPEFNDEYYIFVYNGLNSDESIIDGNTKVYSSIEAKQGNNIKELKTFFRNGIIKIKKVNDGWNLIVDGSIETEVYSPCDDLEPWQVNYEIHEEVPIEVDAWGNTSKIVSFSIKNEKLINSPSLNLRIDGNLINETTNNYISLSETPKGIYVVLFDLDKTLSFDTTYPNYDYEFKGVEDYTNAQIFFDNCKVLVTTPIERVENFSAPIKMQVKTLVLVPEMTEVNIDTGEEIIIPEHIKTDVNYEFETTLTSESLLISVDDTGHIKHQLIEFSFGGEEEVFAGSFTIKDGNYQDLGSFNISHETI